MNFLDSADAVDVEELVLLVIAIIIYGMLNLILIPTHTLADGFMIIVGAAAF